MSRLFLGNIPHSANEMDISDWLKSFGYNTTSVDIITDRNTGLRRGFCFVTLDDDQEMKNAVRALNGKLMSGRPITVNPAVPLRQHPGPEERRTA